MINLRGEDKVNASMLKNIERLNIQISLSNSNKEENWRTYCSELRLEFIHYSGEKDTVEFRFDEKSTLTTAVNGEDYKVKVDAYSMGSFVPLLAVPFENKYNGLLEDGFEFPELFVSNAKRALFYPSEKKEVLLRLFDGLEFSGREEFYNTIKGFDHSGKVFSEKVELLKVDDKKFIDVRNSWVANFSSSILQKINRYLNVKFRNINYSGPKRASVDRFYRLMDLQVNDVDHEGNNLAMFLSSLPKTKMNNLRKWCRDNFDIEVDAKEENGNVSIYVSEKPYINKENVTDMGFGYSQVLPIIVSLWNKITHRVRYGGLYKEVPSIYVIEQPELHLHPKLQAKVASILIKASLIAKQRELNLILIIETHSKEIVDRLSLIGSHNEEVKEMFQILLFNKNRDGNTEVKVSKLNDEGYLDEWPYGFFEPDSKDILEFIDMDK